MLNEAMIMIIISNMLIPSYDDDNDGNDGNNDGNNNGNNNNDVIISKSIDIIIVICI